MKKSRRIWLNTIALALLASSVAPAAAESFNPFEFIFGGLRQRSPVEIVNAGPSDEELARRAAQRAAERRAQDREKAAARHAAIDRNGGVAFKQKSLPAQDGVDTGSVQHFANDHTLRSGDVIVTNEGFLVYRGGGPENANAFAPLTGGRAAGALGSLEKASRQPGGANWAARSPLAVSAEPGLVKPVNITEADRAEKVMRN